MTPPALLTIAEVCSLLQVDEKTLRARVQSGELPRVLIGARVIRFDPRDVETYIKGAKCPSTEKAASGTSISSIAGGATTARPGRRRAGQPKPLSERADLRPLPELARTPET